jgi:signal transduction histidine kinase
VIPVADFFNQYLILIYFIYGLAFFSMGLAILLELGHTSGMDFAYALQPLAAFGLVHGAHEWIEMFLLIQGDFHSGLANIWLPSLRIILLALSFMLLIAFGARLIAGPAGRKLQRIMMLSLLVIWIFGLVWVLNNQPPGPQRMIAADVYTRYSLAIPGAVLAAWGLLLQRRRFIRMRFPDFGRDVLFAALAFALYGCVGQLFSSSSFIFPSEYLNQDLFVRTFGIPVQVFRALMAVLVAVFIIRSMRAFEVENRRRIDEMRDAQLGQRRRFEETRAELLHRTVIAQETERKRIARELHDEIGQTLTALGLGLRGLSQSIETKPERAVEQASQLEDLAVTGLDELQRLVSGLRPPQLDDLGLLAALRWCASEVSEHYQIPIEVAGKENNIQLPSDVRVVLFRIAQEAVTNAIRHSDPSKVTIRLLKEPEQVRLMVEDDGAGFDYDKTLMEAVAGEHWGLLGMMERASLVGGELHITSKPGGGTILNADVPLAQKGDNV